MLGSKREKLLINSRVQRALVLHTIGHWALLLMGTLVLLMFLQVLFGEPTGSFVEHAERMWTRYGPSFVVLLVLMPAVMLDSIKLGHRIAGPMIRLGGALHRVARGEQVKPVHFRKEDFWHEIADDFNTLLNRLESQPSARRQTAEVKPAESQDWADHGVESLKLAATYSD